MNGDTKSVLSFEYRWQSLSYSENCVFLANGSVDQYIGGTDEKNQADRGLPYPLGP
jgi:hypothetical protein